MGKNKIHTILVDCDGVLGDFCGAFLNVFNGIHGTRYKAEDINDFDIINVIPELESDEFWKLCNMEGFCRGIEPITGAIDAIDELRELGLDVVCLTAPMRGPYWIRERYQWLTEEFDFKWSDIVIASRKELVHGDVLIDDKLLNLKNWRNSHNDGIPIIFNAPYNVDADYSEYPCPGWWSFDTWEQIVGFIAKQII